MKEDNTLLKNCSSNLQKVFQKILTVVLLDVKHQFTYQNVDPTLENIQNALETSIHMKFQEEGFLSVHLKDFETSITDYSMYEESLINEKTVLLESKLRETQEQYDDAIRLKIDVIESLRKELKEKEGALKDSVRSYDNFRRSNQDLTAAKDMAEKLDLENKHLKHKLKCMECKFEALNKAMTGKDNNKLLKESELSKQNMTMQDLNEKESNLFEETQKETIHENDKVTVNDINMLEDTLNLSTLNSQVELLTEQIDELNSKKSKVEDNIDVKEGKIISLQSTIDKMKIIILQCKTTEHNLSLQLEYANVTIDKLQRTIGNLKKENEDINKDVHKNNLKSAYIENQWDRIVTMSNKKNDKIEALLDEKNSMKEKLKEKSEILAGKDDEYTKINTELEQVRQKYTKLYKTLEKLKGSYVDLEKRCSLMQKEKAVLQQELSDKVNANESQMSRLLKQLNITKDEFKNELSNSNQDVDISDVAEKIIKKHRHDLTSLKSNMCWMKEALEVSEKDRLDMQSRLSQREEELMKLETKLSMFEDSNKQLSVSLMSQQADTASLHKVLHNAVTSYDGVYTLFEQQEKAIEKERNSFQSEITDLQDKLKRKTGSKNGCSGYYPSKSGVHFSDDLRFILGNIKEQLSSTLNNMSSRQDLELSKFSSTTATHLQSFNDIRSQYSDVQSYQESTYEESGCENIEDITTFPLVNNNSIHDSSHGSDANLSVGSNTQKLNDYLEMHNSVMHQSTFSGDNHDRTLVDQSKPVSSCTSYPRLNPCDKEQSVLSTISDATLSSHACNNSTNSSIQSVVENKSAVKQTQTDNNAVLKLQEKLSQLQQMGTNLKTNNSELTEMMKTHSKKLKMLKNKTSDKQ